jgi:hypothetical protein
LRRDRLINNGKRTVGDCVGWRFGEAPNRPDAQEMVNIKGAEDEN